MTPENPYKGAETPIHRTLLTTDATRSTARNIRETMSERPGLAESTLHWTAQVKILWQNLASGILKPHEFDSLVGTIIADIEDRADIDELTRVHTRGAFIRRAEAQIAHSDRSKTNIGFAIVDVDKFKEINDTYGHDGGDAVLHQSAGHLQRTLRGNDVLGRWGGEEFSLILPLFQGKDITDSVEALERQRIQMAPTVHEAVLGMGINIERDITVSVGVTVYEPDEYEKQFGTHDEQIAAIFLQMGVTPEVFGRFDDEKKQIYQDIAESRRRRTIIENTLGKADKGLYAAKRLGRNRIVAVSQDPDGDDILIDTQSGLGYVENIDVINNKPEPKYELIFVA